MILWARTRVRGLDGVFLFCALLLLGIGLLSLYSAAFQKTQETGINYLQRQMTWAMFGTAIALLLVAVDYHRWLEGAYLLYGLNLLLLVLVLAVGAVRGGAQRWLAIGGFAVQPSELAKISTILALARFLGSRKDFEGPRWKTVLGAVVLLAVPMVLILKEPNLGTASIFFGIGVAMLLAWGVPWKAVAALFGAGALGAPLLWLALADYQRSRLLVFMNPNLDPLGAGYTVIQSRIAVGSGGLWGKGWLSGTQNQLNFLPERHTDFIFSIIGEEWGILGTTLVMALFAILFHRGFSLAAQTRDPFGRLLVVGLLAMLAMHVIVNTGMTLGMMPVVGLPLPFMSYGGSWLMTCLVAVGIVLSVGARRPA
ncbi:MAG: rod shape-determining protein RodA [Candidatus Omnitrophica bacterium]|nr:rod shape-determining protein RodA [Candidatus Omnitrophota bacterium]